MVVSFKIRGAGRFNRKRKNAQTLFLVVGMKAPVIMAE
jgi:hypothetical protein